MLLTMDTKKAFLTTNHSEIFPNAKKSIAVFKLSYLLSSDESHGQVTYGYHNDLK